MKNEFEKCAMVLDPENLVSLYACIYGCWTHTVKTRKSDDKHMLVIINALLSVNRTNLNRYYSVKSR